MGDIRLRCFKCGNSITSGRLSIKQYCNERCRKRAENDRRLRKKTTQGQPAKRGRGRKSLCRDEKIIHLIIQMRQRGIGSKQIADNLPIKISQSSVKTILRQNGHGCYKRVGLTNSQKEEIIERRKHGEQYKNIAIVMGIKINSARNYCRKKGIAILPPPKGKKQCTQCLQFKRLNDFSNNKRNGNGKDSWCKDCRQRRYKQWSSKPDAVQYLRNYRQENKSRDNHKRMLRLRRKRKTDVRFRLHDYVSSQVRHQLNGNKNGRKIKEVLGYSMVTLRRSLSQKMQSGMTWDNYGNEWHIDQRFRLEPLILLGQKIQTSSVAGRYRIYSLCGLKKI